MGGREGLLAFAIVTALISLLYQLGRFAFWGSAFLSQNLSVIAAVLFLYVPAFLLFRRGRDLDEYGLRLHPLVRGLGLYGLAVAMVLPLFTLGYVFYVQRLCPALLAGIGPFGRFMARYLACPLPIPPAMRWPPEFLLTALSQLVVVALPEEFFFRGFLLGRFSERLETRTALLLSTVLFALGHYLVTFSPAALAVFFPGLLFGLLRLWTGSILAGTLFHATCNLLIDTLHRSLG